MSELRITLLGEGGSDRALLQPITWLLRQHAPELAIQAAWADLGRLWTPPRGLGERIVQSARLYPCDVLFVHRDADHADPAERVGEFQAATQRARRQDNVRPPIICVVPVRMLETWLLFDEAAIRTAAGNPRGRQPLELPPLRSLEALPDPKRSFRDVLRAASDLPAQRRRKLRVSPERVAELIDDFAPLRSLAAFARLEDEVRQLLEQHTPTG